MEFQNISPVVECTAGNKGRSLIIYTYKSTLWRVVLQRLGRPYRNAPLTEGVRRVTESDSSYRVLKSRSGEICTPPTRKPHFSEKCLKTLGRELPSPGLPDPPGGPWNITKNR